MEEEKKETQALTDKNMKTTLKYMEGRVTHGIPTRN